MADTLIAIGSFVGHDGKEERIFRAGDPVAADDRAVKKWPHLFQAGEFYNAPKPPPLAVQPGARA